MSPYTIYLLAQVQASGYLPPPEPYRATLLCPGNRSVVERGESSASAAPPVPQAGLSRWPGPGFVTPLG